MIRKIALTVLAIATETMFASTFYNLINKNYNIAWMQSMSTACFVTSYAIIKSIKKKL